MEALATKSLATLKGAGNSVDLKLKYLVELKQDIKHRHCPEGAIPSLFDVARIAIGTPHLIDAGFSILSHLVKRLVLQGQQAIIQVQGIRTYPVLFERVADQKDRMRQRATIAFSDFHTVADKDVEQYIRDTVLASKNPRAKEAGMQWVVDMHKERNILFRTFVPSIVDCLEDADGSVRRAAQSTIIELFQGAPSKSTGDLQKQLEQRNVRKTIIAYIQSELGLVSSVEVEFTPAAPTRASEPQTKQVKSVSASTASDPPFETPPMSVSEQEAVQLEPLYIECTRDLEETFREMHPYFEGKESEHNWLKREKSILKLRRITKGNAPQEFTAIFLGGIKALLDGILKTVNSLRTTVSTIGCHLVQDVARVCGSGIDNMVEILLQNLIKLCANTKKITALKGNVTVTAIMANVSYHIRLTQHIYSACQDKNVQPRSFACGWLMTLITKHGHPRSIIEHAGGLELVEKCIKAGLSDRDKGVREAMRPTYWAFARKWSEKSETIMSALDKKQQEQLIADPANPNPSKALPPTATVGGKSTFSQSTSVVPARPSIKDTIAAQKRAKAAGKNLPERPGSAESIASPMKIMSQSSITRPATAMSTVSRNPSTQTIGNLSSAPMRPRRKAETARPATADPSAGRRTAKAETPLMSPATSPVKGKSKTPAPATSTVNLTTKNSNEPAINSTKAFSKTVEDAATTPFSPKIVDGVATTPVRISAKKGDGPVTRPARLAPKVVEDTAATHVRTGMTDYENHTMSPVKANPSKKVGLDDDEIQGKPSPTKAAEDFTMVIPDLNQRISMSPRPIGSRKENMPAKNVYLQEQRPLKVYEDPIQDTRAPYPSPATHIPRALEELPVNEPATPRDPANGHRLLAEEVTTPDYHEKWKVVEAAERRRINASENIDNPLLSRKILESGIVRIQARSLDVHGFRKLQTLIRTADDSIWEDGYKFEELLLPLFDYLEAPTDDANARTGRAQDLKTQVLVTVRLMLQHQSSYFAVHYPQALCAVLTARKHHDSTSHIVSGLEETAELIVSRCDPASCIDSVLDLLEVDSSAATTTMGMYVLAGLLHKGHQGGAPGRLTGRGPQEGRLGRLAARCLDDTNSDIRRAVIEFVLELHDSVESELFWGLVGGGKADHKSLITYYLARHRAVHQ